jgi:Tol biopolymer transport system component
MNRLGPSTIDLFVANADGSGERKLFSNSDFDYDASFSHDGQWIVFTSEREGHGQSDLYRARVDGANLERLTNHPAVDDQAAFSPDGRQLAFVSSRESGTANIWLMDLSTKNVRNVTGAREIQGTPGKPSGFFRPSWSPDGQWLAFSSDRNTEWTGHEAGAGAGHSQALSVYVMHPDGTGLRRLTDPKMSAGSPSWSADGKRLVFAEIDPARTFLARMGGMAAVSSQIVSIDVATGARLEHTSGPGLKVRPQFLNADRIGYIVKAAPPDSGVIPGITYVGGAKNVAGGMRNAAWSADGSQMVYERTSFAPRRQYQRLYSWDPDYEYQFTDVFPSYSKDGRLVTTDLSATLGNPQTSISSWSADGERRRVFYDPSGAAMMGSWSPDGQRIVFGFGGFFGARSARPARLITMKADGSDARDLTMDLPNAGFPGWSPDGRSVVYRVWGNDGKGGEARGLRLLDLESRAVKVLTTEWDNFPMWSPSGDRILFTRQIATSRDFDVLTMRPDGTDVKQITTTPGADGHATWTADGRSILFMSARTGFKDEAPLYDNSPQPYAQIFIMRPDGSNVRQLTDSRWEDSMPVYVPDQLRTSR